MEALVAKQDHEEEVRAMSRLEDWAATRIQSLARGAAGRAAAAARRLEHMARWKEMYDKDRGANFYYNKASNLLCVRVVASLSQQGCVALGTTTSYSTSY